MILRKAPKIIRTLISPSGILIIGGSILLALIMIGLANPGLLCIYIPIVCLFIATTQNKTIISICALFISLYFLFLIPYFFMGIGYATRTDYQDMPTSVKGIILISIFTLTFLITAANTHRNHIDIQSKIPRHKNPVIFFICILVILIFSSLMLRSGTIFTASYQDLTEDRYAFIDYALVFALMAYLFGRSRKLELVLIATAGIYCFICLLYGYRLRAIQMILLIFLLFFERRYTNTRVIISAITMILLMLMIGAFRSYEKSVSLISIIGYNGDVIISNQGGVFLNANMYIGLVDDGLISATQRIKVFLGNFLSFFLPQTSLSEDYFLPKLAERYFTIPGGGLISGYLYVWGGTIGVAIGGYAIGRLYQYLYSSGANPLAIIYGTIIIANLPRWFAYSPVHFFKMAVWAVITFLLLKAFHRITTNISSGRRI